MPAVLTLSLEEVAIYLEKVDDASYPPVRQGSAAIGNRESDGSVLRFPHSQHWRDVNPMERADLFLVYDLGAELKPLASIKHNDKISDVFLPINTAKRALAQLLGPTPQAKLELCVQAARDLKAAVDDIYSTHFVDKNTGNFAYPPDATTKVIEPWNVWTLERAYQDFEAVFRAEMQAAATYWVPKRGSYNTRDMVDAFDRSFLPDLVGSVGEKALAEYRNAGRCFAFGLWSAAGYHACRAVEAVLRPYYCLLTGKEDNEAKTWGDLIKELRERRDEPKASEKAVFYLQQLKDNERNPLMHVRVVLDEQDADILLNSSKIVIVLMAREIRAINESREELLLENAQKNALLSLVQNDQVAG
jgi:hypothetical protein